MAKRDWEEQKASQNKNLVNYSAKLNERNNLLKNALDRSMQDEETQKAKETYGKKLLDYTDYAASKGSELAAYRDAINAKVNANIDQARAEEAANRHELMLEQKEARLKNSIAAAAEERQIRERLGNLGLTDSGYARNQYETISRSREDYFMTIEQKAKEQADNLSRQLDDYIASQRASGQESIAGKASSVGSSLSQKYAGVQEAYDTYSGLVAPKYEEASSEFMRQFERGIKTRKTDSEKFNYAYDVANSYGLSAEQTQKLLGMIRG